MKTYERIIHAAIAAALTITSAHAQTYKADVPKSITTPDTVETRIGTLKFFDGLPDNETVQKVYDQLDLSRGTEAFMAGIPATAVYAACKGIDDVAERMLDARTLWHYYATGITPAMAYSKPGTGSAYTATARDSQGRYFDGGKTYKITLLAPIPAGQFWSFSVYDNQTRSMLETDQKLAGLDSNQPNIKKKC
jgi:hypothetical protein